MSFLPSVSPPADTEDFADIFDSFMNLPSPSVHEHETVAEPRSSPDPIPALTLPATRGIFIQPSDWSETAVQGAFYDRGTVDNASSLTFEDKFPRPEGGVNNNIQKIPDTINPALLQGPSEVSPSSEGEEDGSHKVDEDSSDSDSGGDFSRYSAAEKGEWKAQTDDDVTRGEDLIGPPSPPFCSDGAYVSVDQWVAHNRPILQDYADSQIHLPLGNRLRVSIDEPSNFILGAIHLLVNRDQKGCTDPSRKLGPQLIENYVNIECWVYEYFRSRYAIQYLDSNVVTLLTIVINNFYEGQVQLIDRLVELAFENMGNCHGSNLGLEHFAFGFDFEMSQDLPFYVETSSRIREPLPIPVVEVPPTSEPVMTNSGRQVKPTKRALAAFKHEQENMDEKQNKENVIFQVKDKQTASVPVPPARQKKKSTQPSYQCTEAPVISHFKPPAVTPTPLKTASQHTKHRPVRPSNLGLPPILPILLSTAGTTTPQSTDRSKSEPSPAASAERPKVSGPPGSNLIVDPPPRLKIKLPPPSVPTSTSPRKGGSEAVSTKTGSSTSQIGSPADASKTENKVQVASHSSFPRPQGPRNVRGHDRGPVRGSASLTPSAGARNTPVPPTTPNPVDAVASAAANPPVAPPTLVNAPNGKNAGGIVTRTRPRRADNRIDPCGDRSSASRSPRKSQPLPLPPQTDPSHPVRKKRKLDDCED